MTFKLKFPKLRNEKMQFSFFKNLFFELYFPYTDLQRIRALKVPSNFHCQIKVEKTAFVHFNFILNLKIKKRQLFSNFQFFFKS